MFYRVFKFLLIGALLCFGILVFAQIPSFELYSSADPCPSGQNCTPYPAVEDVVVYKYQNFIVVTAKIFDVSGVSSAVANIEDPANPGSYMNVEYPSDGNGLMYDDGSHHDGVSGDGVYGTYFNVSNTGHWNVSATYYVDISATDNFTYNSIDLSSGDDYHHAGNIVIGNLEATEIDNLTALPSSVTAGATTVFSAALKYTKGMTLPAGQTVTFTDITNSTTVGTATTNASGVVTLSYTIPVTATADITVQASYGGSVDLQTASSQSSLVIPISGNGSCVTVSNAIICISVPPASTGGISSFTASQTSVAVGSQITLTATMSAGASAEGQLVYFGDDLTQLASAIVDATGQATIIYITQTVGTRTLVAIHNPAGSAGSYKSLDITVTSGDSCTTVSNAIICISTSTSPTIPE